jgi:hypothetical protein
MPCRARKQRMCQLTKGSRRGALTRPKAAWLTRFNSTARSSDRKRPACEGANFSASLSGRTHLFAPAPATVPGRSLLIDGETAGFRRSSTLAQSKGGLCTHPPSPAPRRSACDDEHRVVAGARHGKARHHRVCRRLPLEGTFTLEDRLFGEVCSAGGFIRPLLRSVNNSFVTIPLSRGQFVAGLLPQARTRYTSPEAG